MYFVIGPDGSEHGPVDSLTLQSWIQQGRVRPETLIRAQGTGHTFQANQLPFLQQAFISTPAYPSYRAPYQQAGMIQVTPGSHSVALAVVLSILINGLGQIYNKQVGKGVVVILVSLMLAFFTCGLSLVVTFPLAVIDAALVAGRLDRGEAIGEWQSF